MNIQKSIALLCTGDEHVDNKIKAIIPFTITQKLNT